MCDEGIFVYCYVIWYSDRRQLLSSIQQDALNLSQRQLIGQVIYIHRQFPHQLNHIKLVITIDELTSGFSEMGFLAQFLMIVKQLAFVGLGSFS